MSDYIPNEELSFHPESGTAEQRIRGGKIVWDIVDGEFQPARFFGNPTLAWRSELKNHGWTLEEIKKIHVDDGVLSGWRGEELDRENWSRAWG